MAICGDAFARHPDLVVKDRTELALVGKDIGLVRQVGAAGLHQGDAGQAVLPGEPLGADVLLAGDAVIGAALHRRIVGDDHAGAARHHADAGDDAAAGRHAVIHAFAGELAEFEKRRAGVEQRGDALARQQLLAFLVQPPRAFRPAEHCSRAARMQIGDPRLIGRRLRRYSSLAVDTSDFITAIVRTLIAARQAHHVLADVVEDHFAIERRGLQQTHQRIDIEDAIFLGEAVAAVSTAARYPRP